MWCRDVTLGLNKQKADVDSKVDALPENTLYCSSE